VDNQSAFWSLHPYVYGKTFPAIPFSRATATAWLNGTMEWRNSNGRTAMKRWKLGVRGSLI